MFQTVIPLSYYYILHGNVYQAPDLMSVLRYYALSCILTLFRILNINE